MLPLYILAASIIGAFIGFIGAAILANRKIQRLESETWQAANRYYSRRYQTRETAL
jgi:hypothetical protein